MRNNIDYFNEVVGHIFADLYTEFPKRVAVDPKAIAERLGIKITYPEPHPRPDLLIGEQDSSPRFEKLDTGMNYVVFLEATKQWLQDEGFIRGGDEKGRGQFQLTSQALTAMNAIPDGLDEPLGTKLSDAVKSAGVETGRALICETVGQILGAAAKGFSS